jgi:hypothetical protein
MRNAVMKEETHSFVSRDALTRAWRIATSAVGLTSDAFPYREQVRWAVWFVVACSGLLAGTLLLLWALSGFEDLGLSGHGLVALILGIVFTSALGIALMALTFYSDRIGSDRLGSDRSAAERDTDSK